MEKINFAHDWQLLQDVHNTGELLQIYRPGWDPVENMGQCFSEWEPIERLEHLQLVFSQKPYFGRELRYFNASPWWYKKEFIINGKPKRSSAFLRFEGVDYFCKVWLNGCYLGEHEGYSSPFEFEIGKTIKYESPNILVVKVMSPCDEELVRIMQSGTNISIGARFLTSSKNMVKGTYEHADGFFQRDINPVGIYGEVSLTIYDGARITDDLTIRTSKDKSGNTADVCLQIPVYSDNVEGLIKYRCSIIDEETGIEETSCMKSQKSIIGMNLLGADLKIIDAKRWNCWERGGAKLYSARIELFRGNEEIHTVTRRFGIRDIDLIRNEQETCFILNGKRIFLRGTSYFPDIYLSRMNRERYEKDIRAMKDAGCNVVRVHVHVAKPDFYELCDEMGLLVIQDSDLTWFHPTTEEFTARAVKVFGDMIRQLRNHPSIICWICLNEPELLKLFKERGIINPEEEPASMMKVRPGPQLVEEVRKLDPTRPYIKGSHCKNDPESGDGHDYTGSLGGGNTHYTDIYGRDFKLTTEFGFDAPAAMENMTNIPAIYNRLKPILKDASGMEILHNYQYRYLKYVIEYHRITKYRPCAGYLQFLFTDVSPQSFYGIYDWWGTPKKSLRVFYESNQPLGIMMEYKEKPVAVWVINDLLESLGECTAEWVVSNSKNKEILRETSIIEVKGDSAVRVSDLHFEMNPNEKYRVCLFLKDSTGSIIVQNNYTDAFHHPMHPKGHPDRMSHELGMRVFWA